MFTSHKGKKRCGQVKAARRVLREDGSLLRIDYGHTSRAQREYVEDVDKEMDLWLAVHPSARSPSSTLTLSHGKYAFKERFRKDSSVLNHQIP